MLNKCHTSFRCLSIFMMIVFFSSCCFSIAYSVTATWIFCWICVHINQTVKNYGLIFQGTWIKYRNSTTHTSFSTQFLRTSISLETSSTWTISSSDPWRLSRNSEYLLFIMSHTSSCEKHIKIKKKRGLIDTLQPYRHFALIPEHDSV